MKYMGSKNRISKYIIPILQECINKNNIKCYIEPFVGGANVIDKIVCDSKIGSDNNRYLIALHKRVQSGKPLYDNVPREFYNKVRKCYNANSKGYSDSQIGCVGFLASFNGRFFGGGYAGTKNDRNYYREAKNNLLKQSESNLYKDIKFVFQDYRVYYGVTDCLIYCDPPYDGTKGYSTKFNSLEFWDFVRHISWNNYVFVSEQNAPDDFECIWEHEIKRDIQGRFDGGKKDAVEKLFVYGG